MPAESVIWIGVILSYSSCISVIRLINAVFADWHYGREEPIRAFLYGNVAATKAGLFRVACHCSEPAAGTTAPHSDFCAYGLEEPSPFHEINISKQGFCMKTGSRFLEF